MRGRNLIGCNSLKSRDFWSFSFEYEYIFYWIVLGLYFHSQISSLCFGNFDGMWFIWSLDVCMSLVIFQNGVHGYSSQPQTSFCSFFPSQNLNLSSYLDTQYFPSR